MKQAISATRYAGCSRRQALVILAATLALTAWCLQVALTQVTLPSEKPGGPRDVDLFRHVVERVHAGEDYYDAYESEFENYHAPLRSPFNVRTPVYAWVIGKLPGMVWGQGLLAVLALTTLLLAYAAVGGQGGRLRALVAVLLMIGALVWCLLGEMFLYTEVWAGTLIALSVCAYAHGWRALGVGAGLLALFFRELALPYVVVAVALAWRGGHRREAAAWAAGLALYGLFMTLHVLEVAPRIAPAEDGSDVSNWIRFGGPAFVLGTCRMNLFLVASPPWVAAFYLPLSLLGLAGWRSEMGTRSVLAVALYLLSFSVVGNPFNAYWGLMYAALLPAGVVWAPAALRDLLTAARCKHRRAARRQPAGKETLPAG
jgi:hypothetical protein